LRYPPFARPGAAIAARAIVARAIVAEGAADPPAGDDLPPIEQFLDELPAIDDYLAAEAAPTVEASPEPLRSFEIPASQIEAEGWAVSAWQSYDWSSLAALGRRSPEVAAAESSWNSTEWAEGEAMSEEPNYDWAGGDWSTEGDGPTADEIAAALDAIARRIRSGELAIDQFRGTPPEAAMAAALAAMLRLRR
jgi:hypothetical protein